MEIGMNQQNSNLFKVEIYINDHVLSGKIFCQNGLRLLDVLNLQLNSKSNYIEVDNLFGSMNDVEYEKDDIQFINKSEICFAALSEANIARGLGNNNEKLYPYTKKTPVLVNIQTKSYFLAGDIYINEGLDFHSIFDGIKQFIPLTDVKIINKTGGYKIMACVIINKQKILSYKKVCRAVKCETDIVDRQLHQLLVPEQASLH
jgi:hypothetical protein